MNRFLTLASKALAVVGVLSLMWTAGGMTERKAQAAIVSGGGPDANGNTAPAGSSCYPLPIAPPAPVPACDRWACWPTTNCMVAAGKNTSGLWQCCW